MNRREFLAALTATGAGVAVAGIPANMPKPKVTEFPEGADFWDPEKAPEPIIDPTLPSLFIGGMGFWTEVGRLSDLEIIQERQPLGTMCLDGKPQDMVFECARPPEIGMEVVNLGHGAERLADPTDDAIEYRIIFPAEGLMRGPTCLEFKGYVVESELQFPSIIGPEHGLRLTVAALGTANWSYS